MTEIQSALLTVDPAIAEALEEANALPPEQPSLPPGEWIRKNLFPSIGGSILTILAGAFSLWVLRALLGFMFSPARKWEAVWTNMRLLMTQAYPEAQYVRIWVSLGIVMVLAGLSLAIFRSGGKISMKRLSTWLMVGGFGTIAAVLLTPHNIESAEAEEPFVERSFAEALGDRLLWIIVGAVVAGIGLAIWYGLGERRRQIFVPFLAVIYALLGVAVALLWVVPFGNYAFIPESADAPSEFVAETGVTVAETTQTPWTVMWLLLGGAYLLGTLLRNVIPGNIGKVFLNFCWLLAPFVIYWVIQRDPAFDWDHIWSTDVPLFAAFAIGGGLLLYALSRPNFGEMGRLVAAGLLAFSLFNWVAAFFGWYDDLFGLYEGFNVLQKVRVSFLLLALAALLAPTFAGNRSKRVQFAAGWIAFIGVVHYVFTVVNTPSTLEGIQADTFLGGFNLTLFVAIFTMIFSFPIGLLLALGRTSQMPLFRILSTIYIEMVRGVPLITVLFFFSNILPLFLPSGMDLTELAAVVIGYMLFSAAYLAENVRGGLQSIRRGQFEAADAIGLTTAQRTGFIVLPQALRVSIPPLVGQTIATFKETSLLFIIGAFDLLRIGNNIISQQQPFLGVRKESLLVVCLIYWVGSFSMSKYSQKLERRLGVGER